MFQKTNPHPYHYSVEKNLVQKLLDWGVPIGLFWVYFQFYNFGKITPAEMIKTTGLLAIALLSLTLAIGPICRFFPSLDILKAHRKFWGITSFLVAVAHFGLIIIYYLQWDLAKLFNLTDPKLLGLWAGIAAIFVLGMITLSSMPKFLHSLDPKVWKFIQTTSYLALILAVIHFYIVESQNGVLVIRRILGQITFGFAVFTIILRLIIVILPKKK